MQPQGGPPQGGYQQASPMQKTMIAQASPFAGGQGGPGPGMQPPPGGGYQQASAMQKTMVAGMAPPIGGPGMMQTGMPAGMPQPGMPGGMPPGMQPGMGMPNAPGGAPGAPGANKTMLLQPSEGVVSVARSGHAVQPAGPGGMQEGASTLFWAVSLVVGIAVGTIAYVIVAAV